ncbi:MAG: TrkH family potassium uptake protein [Cyanobacteria bacterium P01_H01_bin.15]
MSVARTICFGFLVLIGIGTLLLTLPLAISAPGWNSPLIALFTATSAACVTGLAVVDTGTYYSVFGHLVILGLIQLGGLGYMITTTFLILLIGRRFDLRQKFAIQESFDRPFLQGSRNLVRSIIAMTALFELTGVILLFWGFLSADYSPLRSLWYAIFHSISAWNNAGFALFPDSLTLFRSSPLILLSISGLVVFGGIGYQVIIELTNWLTRIVKGRKERFIFSLNFRVVTGTTILLLGLGFFAFLFAEFSDPETFGTLAWGEKLLAAWFLSVTTRTAGFNTIDMGGLSTAGLFLTIGFMFIGASPSGTGGGIKTTTLRILSVSTRTVLEGGDEVNLFEREIPLPLILKAIAVVFGSAVTIVIITILISVIEHSLGLISILFEVVSAFATVGLSTGITASLTGISQCLLILTMFAGRVGILILISAIIGESKPTRLQYPKENLLVG